MIEHVKQLKEQSLLKGMFIVIKNFVALKKWKLVMKERADLAYSRQL
jgi:hypothetical protein